MQGQNVFLVLFLLLIQVMAAVWYVPSFHETSPRRFLQYNRLVSDSCVFLPRVSACGDQVYAILRKSSIIFIPLPVAASCHTISP